MKKAYRSMIWHVLNTWHNPLTAFIHMRREGVSLWLLVPLTVLALAAGAGLVAVVIAAVGR